MDHAMSVRETFERDGVVVLPNIVSHDQVAEWLGAYLQFIEYGRKVGWNKVEVKGPFPEPLASMPKHPNLLDAVQAVFGPDIALYNHRFVVKDHHATGDVFMHQDSGYHVGFMRKASMFVALTRMDNLNGGLHFVMGSHKYGYLGDTGEIAGKHLTSTFTLNPGDAILMHSATWHRSSANYSKLDRILADIIYQPANDPSGTELLCGEWKCVPQAWLRKDGILARSRVSRIRELEEQVAALTTLKATT